MTGCAPGSTPRATALPADRMVFMVMSAGGMVPSVIYAMQSPSLAMYGDGRVLTVIPAPALQPVPARYEVARVDPADVQQFVAAARSSGLLGGSIDFGAPRMTDLATTTVLANDHGEPAQVRVYALNQQFETGLTPAQRDARDRLRALIASAAALPGGAPRQPFSPERVTVHEPLPGRNDEPATAVWPGPPLSDFMNASTARRAVACGELTGPAAGAVYQAALQNPGARWLVDGTTRVLAVNPLPLAGCS
jgi:hypothetical protein